jgi:hypothetical protein
MNDMDRLALDGVLSALRQLSNYDNYGTGRQFKTYIDVARFAAAAVAEAEEKAAQ